MAIVGIKVVIADDDDHVRNALCQILSREPDIEVLTTVSEGGAAVASVMELKPDVLLLDIPLPQHESIEAILLSKAVVPDIKILVLSVSEAEDDLWKALCLGADGFFLPNATIYEITNAVKRVVGGEAILTDSMIVRLIAEFHRRIKNINRRSKIERTVLQMLTGGMDREAVANHLYISGELVNIYLAGLLDDLQRVNRAESQAYFENTRLSIERF
jgi:DNA-binding NarL/FixJ family response regulator